MNAPQEQPSCYRVAIREEAVALRPELADLEFTADQPVAALGLDSVELIELIGALTSRFSVEIPDEDLDVVDTLEDLEKLLERHVTKATPS